MKYIMNVLIILATIGVTSVVTHQIIIATIKPITVIIPEKVMEGEQITGVHHFLSGLKWPDCVLNDQFCKSFNRQERTEIIETEKAYYIKIGKE